MDAKAVRDRGRQSTGHDPASEHRFAQAREVADELAREPGVLGVAVFGSVARRTPTPTSDTDLLVMVEEEAPSRTQLVARLPDRLKRHRLGVQRYSRSDLRELLSQKTSFTAHLRREAQVLRDDTGELTTMLRSRPTRGVSLREELDAHVTQLDDFSDLSLFRGDYLYVLGRVYAIAKAIIMLGMYSSGKPDFDRNHAFAAFARDYPETERAVAIVERLQPFYLYLVRRIESGFPFPYEGSTAQVTEALRAVRTIAAAVRSGR